ncbi:hypothetical protein H6G76_30890 [Nostoc sp. FACHB-152]|uniref:hypothetical protein n=1 Tax=unclassified Nostoc TaxID=2593658 RepID=UPI001682C5FE|nr:MULTISPECIES: hypothetical protein [unclassified Nostoc]MBD2451452.1 hypothetical protein [Nostoc sp. FACHB-152]MBD2469988.1 hypothetical protein [Nostoc sp. FACHB-145]
MIRRFLLASALFVTGTVVAAPGAFAGTTGETADQTVNFQGIIPQVCVFGSASSGTLAISGPNSKTLSTSSTGGGQGGTSVTCNYGAQLGIAAPIAGAGAASALTPTSLTSKATASSATLTSSEAKSDGTKVTLKTSEATTINVDMDVNNGTTVIPAGTYNYTVTLTVAP